MSAAKEKIAAPKVRETLSEQVVVRVKPSLRRKLDRYVKKSNLRGVGDAVRHILETAQWE